MFSFRSQPRQALSNTDLVGNLVTAWAAKNRTVNSPRGPFVLDGSPLADADLGDSITLLPLLVWHADSLYRYGINSNGLGATFHADHEALLSRSVNLDRVHRSASELLCFTLEALEDARAHLPKSESVKGAVEIRSLVNKFTESFGTTPALAPAPSGPNTGTVRPQA